MKERIKKFASKFLKRIIQLKLVPLLGIIGGFTGIITIYTWINLKPKFGFYKSTVITGTSGQVSVIQIDGAIFNDGSKSLFPVNYHLNVKYKDGSEYTFQSLFIPKYIKDSLYKSRSKIRIDSAYDLIGLTTVKEDDAIWGRLYFGNMGDDVRSEPPEDIKQIVMFCEDITGKERKV